MTREFYPRSRQTNLVVQELKDEVLIYDLDTQKAVCLNQTAALVWELCDGKKSIGEISQSLSEKLNLPANEELVRLAIDRLKKEKLMANDEKDPVDTLAGLSRRAVIKKVGLATMIALPVITGLIAPISASAQSCVANDAVAGMASLPANCTTIPIGVSDAACQATYSNACCSGRSHLQRGSAPAGAPCIFNCSCF